MVVSDLLLTPEATPSTQGPHRRTRPGPRHLGRPGHPHRRRQPVRPDRVRRPAGYGRSGHRRPPGTGPGLPPLPPGRRAPHPPPAGHPRARGHRPAACATDVDGASDVVASLAAAGVEHLGAVDLHVQTGTGERVVRVEPGVHVYGPPPHRRPHRRRQAGSAPAQRPALAGHGPGLTRGRTVAGRRRPAARPVGPLTRFVVSRTLYRRFGTVRVVAPGALRRRPPAPRVAVTPWLLGHLGNGLPARALRHAHAADLNDQLVVALRVAIVVLVVLAVVLGLLSRRMWSILGGGDPRGGAHRGRGQRRGPRRRPAAGGQGLRRPDHRGHLPLRADQSRAPGSTPTSAPPPRWWPSTGAGWACPRCSCTASGSAGSRSSRAPSSTSACCWPTTSSASPSRLERAVTRGRIGGSLHPSLVASYPVGDSWPPAPDLRQAHRRTRRVRRWGAAAILVTGYHRPPRLHHPARSAAACTRSSSSCRSGPAWPPVPWWPLAGLALIALGRGILRGQRRAWRVSVALLAGTILLHLVAGADVEESLDRRGGPGLPAGQPQGVPGRLRRHVAALRAHQALAAVALGVAVVATVSLELFTHIGRHQQPHPALVDDVLGGVRAVRRDHHHPPAPTGRTASSPPPYSPSGSAWWR